MMAWSCCSRKSCVRTGTGRTSSMYSSSSWALSWMSCWAAAWGVAFTTAGDGGAVSTWTVGVIGARWRGADGVARFGVKVVLFLTAPRLLRLLL